MDVPNIRLVDFERVTINKGESIEVVLGITPRYRSVVYNSTTENWWNPMIYIEQGKVNIYVGGGQPKYFDGSLNATIAVKQTKPLSSCPNQD